MTTVFFQWDETKSPGTEDREGSTAALAPLFILRVKGAIEKREAALVILTSLLQR